MNLFTFRNDKTITLTENVDTHTANEFNSGPVTTFGGVLQTFQSGDNLTGTGDDPTLNLTWTATGAGAPPATVVVPKMTGIETFNVSNFGARGSRLEIQSNDITGMKNVNVTSSTGNLTMNNLNSLLENVTLKNTDSATDIHILNTQLAGSTDELNLMLQGSLVNSTFNVQPVSGTNGYETLNVKSETSANVIDTIASAGTPTYKFSGDQNLTIIGGGGISPLPGAARTIDASEMTGNFVLGSITGGLSRAFATNATAVGSVTVNGGEGNDSFFISNLSNVYKIDGGDGTDTLVLTAAAGQAGDPAAVATPAAISNIENLRITQGDGTALGADRAFNLTGTSSVENLMLNADTVTGAQTKTVTIDQLTHNNDLTVQYIGTKVQENQFFNALTYNPAGALGASDRMAVTVSNQGQALGADTVTLGKQTYNNVETVTMTVTDMSASSRLTGNNIVGTNMANFEFITDGTRAAQGSYNLGTIGAVDTMKQVVIRSDAGVTAKIDHAAGGNVALHGAGNHNVQLDSTGDLTGVINAAAATGDLTLTSTTTANVTITGGSGADAIAVAGDATVRGGGGNDSISGGAAGDNVTIVYEATAAANEQDVITNFTGNGADKLDFTAFLGAAAARAAGMDGSAAGVDLSGANNVTLFHSNATLTAADIVGVAAGAGEIQMADNGSAVLLATAVGDFVTDGSDYNVFYIWDANPGVGTDWQVATVGTVTQLGAPAMDAAAVFI